MDRTQEYGSISTNVHTTFWVPTLLFEITLPAKVKLLLENTVNHIIIPIGAVNLEIHCNH